MVVYKTNMNTIPNNCIECDLHLCTLPCRHSSRGGTITDLIKKEYTKRRHKACPLMEVKDASKEEVSEART